MGTNQDCLHMHQMSSSGANAIFRGNAIEYGQQRGIVIHGTHLSTVENNVINDVRGAGICKFRAKRVITLIARGMNTTHETLLARARRCTPPLARLADVEDGNEMYNQIKYNVYICPWALKGDKYGCAVPGTDNSQADTSTNQAGIWA